MLPRRLVYYRKMRDEVFLMQELDANALHTTELGVRAHPEKPRLRR